MRASVIFRFQREFLRFTLVLGIMIGPPSVSPIWLLAVDAFTGARPLFDAEAKEYGRAFSAELAKL